MQRGRRRPTPHFCQTTNAARARYTRVPAVLLSKDKRCLFLCVACMHRRAQQCPTMPRHVELLVYCFSPFQTRRLGECHPLDTPARVGFTKTPLSDAYASEPGGSSGSTGASPPPLRRTGGQDVKGWPANPELVRHLKSTLKSYPDVCTCG